MKIMKTCRMSAIAAASALFPMAAAAQDVGAIASDLSGQTSLVVTLISIIAFALGLGMAIAGFLKFRANSQNPNDPSNKLSTAFMLLFVGAGLVALPATLGSGISTIFGDSAATTNAKADGGGFTQVK